MHLEIGERFDQADPANDEFHPIFLDHLSAHIQVALFHGLQNLLEREAAGAEAHRRDFHLVLADKAADAADLGHAGHGVELVADEPILQARATARGRSRLWASGRDPPPGSTDRPSPARWRRGQAWAPPRAAGDRRGS